MLNGDACTAEVVVFAGVMQAPGRHGCGCGSLDECALEVRRARVESWAQFWTQTQNH